jgi:protein-S-isoprenylcysteine O-methyltransferase Ste14
MNIAPHFLLAVLWIVFCLLHSLLAADSIKQRLAPATAKAEALYRLLYIVFALLSFAAVVLYQLSVSSRRLFHPGTVLTLAGCAGALAGLIVMSICISRYFPVVSGLRGTLKKRESGRLLVTGLNHYVRHPLYMGTFIFIWSAWLVVPLLSLLISNTIITVYTVIGTGMEEKKLVRAFGNEYRAYQKKVPMFLPRPGRR